MTKEETLERFQEYTHHWTSYLQPKRYAKILTKKECNQLLDLARSGLREFRLFNDHGYALDDSYNRIYIYERRK